MREDDQNFHRQYEIEGLQKELKYAIERASKAERRKRELATELLSQRTNNQNTIHELESKISNYEVTKRIYCLYFYYL